MSVKKSYGVTKCVTTRRVAPGQRKIRKSIRLSIWLWDRIDLFMAQTGLNRSTSIEFICMRYLSENLHELRKKLDEAKENVALYQQKITNLKERKELIKNEQ